LCIDEYIVDGFDGGFIGGFDGRFNGGFHLAVLGYSPQQSVQQLRQEAFTAISQEGLTGLLLNKLIVLQTLFTDSLMAISQEGIKAIIIVT
jgi:hypothetical protein